MPGVNADRHDRRRAEGAVRLLAEAGRELTASLDYEATLTRVARLALPALADWCQIDLLDSVDDGSTGGNRPDEADGYRTVTTTHVDPGQEQLIAELRRRYPPDPTRGHGIWHVLRTGESLLVRDAALVQAEDARDPEHLALMRQVGTRSVIRVPLAVRGGQRLGVLSFGLTRSDGRFDDADLALAEEIGRRAAVAVDNARLYRAEQRARAAAEDAVRARDEFLSIAAHELKTPITSVLGSAQLERRRLRAGGGGGVDPERHDRALATIEEQAQRLSRLVSDLLDVSRLERGHLLLAPQDTDLGQLAQRVAGALQPATTHRLCVTSSMSGGEPVVACVDPLRIEQVLTSLIDNARKFSPRDSEIRIDVWQPDAADVGDGRDGEMVRLSVLDSGIGVAPEHRAHLFDRFYRGHVGSAGQAGVAAGGMGIGLYISRQIVERHGGRIWAEFPEEGGSRFVLELPRGDYAHSVLRQ